ncbi:lipoprotein-releasing system ATP-binding protein LolD [archaeon BMS3Bbin15]|nr:lipoprotein-releasing system ATP-binding protein LolD [archaeon BMS3Bbin15]
MSTVIELENVYKVYQMGKEKVTALKDVDVAIDKGEFISVIGPSGGGKSTLMQIMGCLDQPSSGSVYIDGLSTSKLRDSKLAKLRGKKIGFVFQASYLYPTLNVRENVELPMLIQGTAPSIRRERAEKILLDIGGLENIMAHFPSEISGGQQQRVAIARALANDPAIILADEPTGNIDSKQSQQVMDVFTSLHDRGYTIIIATHDMDVANVVIKKGGRMIKIKDGQVEEEK